MIGKLIFLSKIKKAGRDFQKAPEINTRGKKTQTYETDIQENKELKKKKVSIRRRNDCSLIVFTDVLFSDVEKVDGGELKYYYEHCKKYTNDTIVFDIIKNGLKLDFNEISFQYCWKMFLLERKK